MEEGQEKCEIVPSENSPHVGEEEGGTALHHSTELQAATGKQHAEAEEQMAQEGVSITPENNRSEPTGAGPASKAAQAPLQPAQQPQLRGFPQPGRQTSHDSGYSSTQERARSDSTDSSQAEGYHSRFEHPMTLQLNTKAGATEGGGKGMGYPTAATTPISEKSEFVPGIENPKTTYQDNSKLVVQTPPPTPMRHNQGKLITSRQLSLPGTQRERERVNWQTNNHLAPGTRG